MIFTLGHYIQRFHAAARMRGPMILATSVLEEEEYAQSKELFEAILNGDAKRHTLPLKWLCRGRGTNAANCRLHGAAMDEVGKLFEAEEYFVPELLLAGRAMKERQGKLIKPLLVASGQKMAVPSSSNSQGRPSRIGRHVPP